MSEEKLLEKKVLSEKIYFEDSKAKVTNVRLTCNHLTVPVEKIGSVNINYKIEIFSLAVFCFIISCSPFLFLSSLSDRFKIPVSGIAGVAVVLVLASLVLLLLVYKSYVELIASVGGRMVKLLTFSMGQKEYAENMCSRIGDAILDEKKYRALIAGGELEDSLKLNASETLRLKVIIDEYEELKKMKDEFSKHVEEDKNDKKED